ncbi:predicted protein [Nematostella vectensis]|uniref:ZSWIM1/3 RNaseH-like domain-containing protein n=1 Tax=Nematostella vectensis TaxID=45351 RepID=A7SXN4_NEMVE|nr:predicted protein [Nematostella vectensis]|eukprot:XP_001623641.1 predicted protein [Nematostella vectensis]
MEMGSENIKDHEEHKYPHDYFKIDDYYGYVSNLKTAEKLIEEFETRHTVKFSSFKVDKNVGNGDFKGSNHRVSWEDTKEVCGRRLLFTGCPFFIIGNKKHNCQHGKDKNAAAKISRNKQEDGDFNFKKRQFNAQPTKKKNCPARLILRGIIAFHDYKGSGLSQPVDTRIIKKIEELVNDGVKDTYEMRRHLKIFVKKKLFTENNAPSSFNPRFFPKMGDIRSHMYRATVKNRFSKIDQGNVAENVSQWKEQNPEDFFFFRPHGGASASEEDPVEDHNNDDEEEELEAGKEQEIIINMPKRNSLLFVHQNVWQRRLLKRYGNGICLLDATYKTTKYALPLFFLAVRTNVDYQVVGSFVTQDETTPSLIEALTLLKQATPTWSPEYFITDNSKQEIAAIETVFPGNLSTCSDTSFILGAWFICVTFIESRRRRDGRVKYQKSFTEDIYLECVNILKESAIWKKNEAMRRWFENIWLKAHRRWVQAFRENISVHTNNGVARRNEELKYNFLSSHRDKSLSGLLSVLINEYFPEKYARYIEKNTRPKYVIDMARQRIISAEEVADTGVNARDLEMTQLTSQYQESPESLPTRKRKPVPQGLGKSCRELLHEKKDLTFQVDHGHLSKLHSQLANVHRELMHCVPRDGGLVLNEPESKKRKTNMSKIPLPVKRKNKFSGRVGSHAATMRKTFNVHVPVRMSTKSLKPINPLSNPKPNNPSSNPKPNNPASNPKPNNPSSNPKPNNPASNPKPNNPSSNPKPNNPASNPKPNNPSSNPKPNNPASNPKPNNPASNPKPNNPASNPKPNNPSSNPKPNNPSSNPKPNNPSSNPKPNNPSSNPKPNNPAFNPKPNNPAFNPKPNNPASNPKPNNPASNPKPNNPSSNPKPNNPSSNPKPNNPASNPKPNNPSSNPKPNNPASNPKPNNPSSNPKPNNPASNPKPNNPSSNPKPNNPSSNPKPNNPSSNPKPNNPSSNPKPNNPASNPKPNNPSSNPKPNNPSSNPKPNNPSSNPKSNNPASNPKSNNPASNPKPNNPGTYLKRKSCSESQQIHTSTSASKKRKVP